MAPRKLPNDYLFGESQVIDNETITTFTIYLWFFAMIFAGVFGAFASLTPIGRFCNFISIVLQIISVSSIVVNVATQIETKILKALKKTAP